MESTKQTYDELGYLVVPQLIAPPVRSFLYEYAAKSADAGKLLPGDADVPNSPHAYGDPFFEFLLEWLLHRIEGFTGRSLFPTYSYFRVYLNGAELRRHTDRPACEVSVTANVGCDAGLIWPIFVETDQAAKAISLRPGDALLYKGTVLPHWRERFSGQRTVQAFLHYVDQNGPHGEWRYDKRSDLTRSPTATLLMNQIAKGL